MSVKYYSIKEFAELLGISPQSIYKRLKKENDPLHNYTKVEDSKTLIADSAVAEVFKRGAIPQENAEERKDSPPLDDIIFLLNEQIDTLKRALESKEEEVKRLTAQNERLYKMLEDQQRMTEHQQQLSALDKKNILLLEEKINKKKKGIFGWFNRKEVEENG